MTALPTIPDFCVTIVLCPSSFYRVIAQLYPDICNWKPKTKTITLEKFSVFCLVVPNLMSLEISPPEIEELFQASIRASSDRGRKKALEAAAEEMKKREEGLTPEELEAFRKAVKKEKPARVGGGKKVMDAEVFSEFALPMVRKGET